MKDKEEQSKKVFYYNEDVSYKCKVFPTTLATSINHLQILKTIHNYTGTSQIYDP